MLMRFNKWLLAALVSGALSGSVQAQSELTVAVMDGDLNAVNALIRRDVDLNFVERDGTHALQWAVYQENPAMVRSLVRAGADVDAPNREGMTPLLLAAMAGNADIVEILLDAGAGVNNTMLNWETPLMMAARTGDLDTIQLLLDRGASLEATDSLRGTTALMWAAANRNADAVQLLLDNGASLATRSGMAEPGRSPYLAPTARNRIRGFYKGVGQGGDFGGSDELRDQNLQLKVSREELVARLPEQLVKDFENEDVRVGDFGETIDPAPAKKWGGLNALHFAVREGDMATVKVLVEAGADVNQVSEFGWTPLLTATQNRFYQVGKYLLEHGANPNIANEGGWNPLYIATDNRNIEGGDYPTRKPDMDHLSFIKLLLEHGADPNLRMASSTETRTIFTHQWLREEGATPFLRAAQSSDLTLMKLLLEHGADPNINTSVGVTPLMVAAGIAWVEGVTFEWSEEANEEAIRMLIELGNDVNAQDREDGRTALMGAAHKGRNYAVQLLADAGADFSLRDIGSRDSVYQLAGTTWQAIDYAEGLVRVGVQSAESHPETSALIRKLMLERGLDVPPEGRTLDSICVVDICK
jgi:ankyrin repeat protein